MCARTCARARARAAGKPLSRAAHAHAAEQEHGLAAHLHGRSVALLLRAPRDDRQRRERGRQLRPDALVGVAAHERSAQRQVRFGHAVLEVLEVAEEALLAARVEPARHDELVDRRERRQVLAHEEARQVRRQVVQVALAQQARRPHDARVLDVAALEEDGLVGGHAASAVPGAGGGRLGVGELVDVLPDAGVDGREAGLVLGQLMQLGAVRNEPDLLHAQLRQDRRNEHEPLELGPAVGSAEGPVVVFRPEAAELLASRRGKRHPADRVTGSDSAAGHGPADRTCGLGNTKIRV